MRIRTLWLTDFRNCASVHVDLAPGLTALLGANGEGKTNVLEALGWLATLSSFRGAPNEALVRRDVTSAIVRALVEREGRELLIEGQIQSSGRNRVLVNRQPLRRARDLLGSLRVTVFTPDDLDIVKGGPGARRRFLDEALVAVHPRNDVLRADVERVLRQRNALLKQTGGRLDQTAAFTLDVWDAKLAEAGGALVAARVDLLERLRPVLGEIYDALARRPAATDAHYSSTWWRPLPAGGAPVDGGAVDGSAASGDTGSDRRAGGTGGPVGAFASALAAARGDDLRRGVSTVGPHRDEVALFVTGAPARTYASQGEQRTLALALRLAVHEVVTETTGSPPVLLLDDVFSELDPERSDALLDRLPPGQTLLTSAGELPAAARPELVLRIAGGRVGPEVRSGR